MVNENLRIIDLHFQGRDQAIASHLLTSEDEAVLIETGPATTLDSLMSGLRAAGVAPERVTKLLLTHIHLDHAGATGSLMSRLPNATVYVHEVGAPHLIDPSRLIESAARIYGDEMDSLWGEVLPVPEDRLVVLKDGERVQAGGVVLQALYTPGHASHHIAYRDASSDTVFAGDVAGVRLPGTKRAMPPTPPPDLDLEQWSASIDRLLEIEPRTLYLTHFGPIYDARPHLEELRIRLYEWGDLILGGLRGGLSEEELAIRLEEHANEALSGSVSDPAIRARFRLVSGYGMNVAGYIRYFRKRGDLVHDQESFRAMERS